MTSTLLDEPATPPTANPAQRLRATMIAVPVGFTWFGTRKTLTPEQKKRSCGYVRRRGIILVGRRGGPLQESIASIASKPVCSVALRGGRASHFFCHWRANGRSFNREQACKPNYVGPGGPPHLRDCLIRRLAAHEQFPPSLRFAEVEYAVPGCE